MFLQLIASIAAIGVVISVLSKGVIGKRTSTGKCHQFYENGDCECCEAKFRGSKCEHYCETCITINNGQFCKYFCPDGYYGRTCEKQCPKSCKAGNSGLPICTEFGNSFDCSNGCREGLFGRQCNNTCSTKCNNSICNKINGICVECQENYFGDSCDRNCLHCVGGCFQNGTCKDGCREGYKGQLCDTKCFTSCEQCKETCSMQCQESCPETIFEICTQNSTCAYTCSGFYENDQVCPKKIVPPEKVEEAEGSPTVVIVLVVLLVVLVVIAVIAVLYIKRRRRGRAYNTRRTTSTDLDTNAAGSDNDTNEYLLRERPAHGESAHQPPDTLRETTNLAQDDNGTREYLLGDGLAHGEPLDQLPDTFNETTHSDRDESENLFHKPGDQFASTESLSHFPKVFRGIKRSTTNLEEIEPSDIPEIGSQVNKGIIVITSSPQGKKSITQMMDKWKHYSVQGDEAEFTVGKIGSKDIASIHLSKDLYGKIGTANFITLCLGKFKHVKHVIILGVCSVSEKQREVIRLGDVVTSVSNFDQPYIYVQPSDTGEKNFAPEDDSLQIIVKNFIASGDRTPWEKHIEKGLVDVEEVPRLHNGVFGTSRVDDKKESDDAIVAMETGIEQVLESITGSGIKSFLLVCAVSEDQNETAESTLAAASVVRAVIEQIDDCLG